MKKYLLQDLLSSHRHLFRSILHLTFHILIHAGLSIYSFRCTNPCHVQSETEPSNYMLPKDHSLSKQYFYSSFLLLYILLNSHMQYNLYMAHNNTLVPLCINLYSSLRYTGRDSRTNKNMLFNSRKTLPQYSKYRSHRKPIIHS